MGGVAEARRWVLVSMLTAMAPPGRWIKANREHLGLSTRELGALAGVSYPTISRIEHGHTNPRWDTMTTVARSLGFAFGPEGPSPLPLVHIADLADAWDQSVEGDHQPDWTRFRALADQLHRHPELTGVAIAAAPDPSASEVIDNLLAATAERIADEANLRRPRWTASIAPLGTTWETPGTPRMRSANAASTPSQFAERGLRVPVTAIWRARHARPA